MIPHDVEARCRHQRGESGKQTLRLEDYVGGPVAPAVPQLIQEPAVGQERQAIRCDGGARRIAAQTLQSKAVPSRDGDISMKAEARDRRTARTGHYGGIRQFLHSADFHDALAGMRTHGDALGDRGAVKLGQQRLLLPEIIRFLRISPRPQTAMLQQTSHAPANTGGDPGDFPIPGRCHRLEYDLTLFVFEV